MNPADSPPTGTAVRDSVRLYVARCDESPLAPEWGWLTDEELRRAGGFRQTLVRNEFITGRRLARLALSGLLGKAPGELTFRIAGSGQPFLVAGPGGDGGHFCIAHSHGLVVCAACARQPVGADLEPERRGPTLRGLEDRFLDTVEREARANLADPVRDAWALRRWVDKEAYSKLLGLGRQLPFDRFRLLDAGKDLAHVVTAHPWDGPLEVHRWHPRVAAGYQVAVVCESGTGPPMALSVVDLGGPG